MLVVYVFLYAWAMLLHVSGMSERRYCRLCCSNAVLVDYIPIYTSERQAITPYGLALSFRKFFDASRHYRA